MLRLVTFPFRAGVKVGTTSTKVGYRTARFLGIKRLFLVGTGVAIGLLIAPVPGRELRAKLMELLEGATSVEPDSGAMTAATSGADDTRVLQASGTNGAL